MARMRMLDGVLGNMRRCVLSYRTPACYCCVKSVKRSYLQGGFTQAQWHQVLSSCCNNHTHTVPSPAIIHLLTHRSLTRGSLAGELVEDGQLRQLE